MEDGVLWEPSPGPGFWLFSSHRTDLYRGWIIVASVVTWWPKLSPATQTWLVHHVTDSIPMDVVSEIFAAGGSRTGDAWFVSQKNTPPGVYLSEETQQWIDAHGTR